MAGGEQQRKCWGRAEDRALRRAVSLRGAHRWAQVAAEPGLERRTPKSCRLRWLNHLSPAVVKERFSEDESRAIALGYARNGPRWAHIAKELHGRTDSAVKNHWNNYLKHRYVRVLTGILQNPQVADIRAAAAFGVGPSILKAAIVSHASAQLDSEGKPAAKDGVPAKPTEDVSPSHSMQKSPDLPEHITNISNGDFERRLVLEEMAKRSLKAGCPGEVASLAAQRDAAVRLQRRHAAEVIAAAEAKQVKSSTSLRSWMNTSAFNHSAIESAFVCSNAWSEPAPDVETLVSEATAEIDMRSCPERALSGCYSSSSTNMFLSDASMASPHRGGGTSSSPLGHSLLDKLHLADIDIWSHCQSPSLYPNLQEESVQQGSLCNSENNSFASCPTDSCMPGPGHVNGGDGWRGAPSSPGLPSAKKAELQSAIFAGALSMAAQNAVCFAPSGADMEPLDGFTSCTAASFNGGSFSMLPPPLPVPASQSLPIQCSRENESVHSTHITDAFWTLLGTNPGLARRLLENTSAFGIHGIEEDPQLSSSSEAASYALPH